MGYDLPVAEEEGEEEPEFDAILAIVDPNKDGSVQLQVIREFRDQFGFFGFDIRISDDFQFVTNQKFVICIKENQTSKQMIVWKIKR